MHFLAILKLGDSNLMLLNHFLLQSCVKFWLFSVFYVVKAPNKIRILDEKSGFRIPGFWDKNPDIGPYINVKQKNKRENKFPITRKLGTY